LLKLNKNLDLTIIKALAVLEKIENTSSRNEKEKLLFDSKNNVVLKNIFKLTHSSDRYYVFPDETCKSQKIKDTLISRWKQFQSICTDLVNRKITGNASFELIHDFLISCEPIENKWFTRILNRNLALGIGETTLYKIWPSLLDTKNNFNKCMLADTWDESLFKEPFKLAGEKKFDGIRCITTIDKNGNITLFTRGGKVINHLEHIVNSIKKLNLKSRMLDGELCVFNRDTGLTDWPKTLSLAKPRKHISDSMRKEIETCVEYHIFDTLNLNAYLNNNSTINLKKRRHKLKSILSKTDSCISIVEQKIFRTKKQISNFYTNCLESGYEGVILKDLDSTYICDRKKSWMKIKPTIDKTGIIMGFVEGKDRHSRVTPEMEQIVKTILIKKLGKLIKTKIGYKIKAPNEETYINIRSKLRPDIRQRLYIKNKYLYFRTEPRLGSLIVIPNNEKEIINVSGLTDQVREEIWDNQKHYLNMLVDYKEQKDTGDVGKTRFPRFIRFRLKKDI